jgi:hypothetical protein
VSRYVLAVLLLPVFLGTVPLLAEGPGASAVLRHIPITWQVDRLLWPAVAMHFGLTYQAFGNGAAKMPYCSF